MSAAELVEGEDTPTFTKEEEDEVQDVLSFTPNLRPCDLAILVSKPCSKVLVIVSVTFLILRWTLQVYAIREKIVHSEVGNNVNTATREDTRSTKEKKRMREHLNPNFAL
jgi:hypothetical protein